MITAFLGYERAAPCGASSLSASSLRVASGPMPIDTACDNDMGVLPGGSPGVRRDSGTPGAVLHRTNVPDTPPAPLTGGRPLVHPCAPHPHTHTPTHTTPP